MSDNKKGFDNFDDFLEASEPPPPLHEQKVDRNEDGEFASKMYDQEFLSKEAFVPKMTFGSYFPKLSIEWETVRDLFTYAEDIYEKIMAVFMFLTVAAAFNPVLLSLMAFSGNEATDIMRLIFLFALVITFILSLLVLEKSFSLIVLGVILILKAVLFWETISDILFAASFMGVVYLMYRVKERKDTE